MAIFSSIKLARKDRPKSPTHMPWVSHLDENTAYLKKPRESGRRTCGRKQRGGLLSRSQTQQGLASPGAGGGQKP